MFKNQFFASVIAVFMLTSARVPKAQADESKNELSDPKKLELGIVAGYKDARNLGLYILGQSF